jgi:hypothetical protein
VRDPLELGYALCMPTRFLLILSAALICNGECVQVAAPQYGRIEVSAFSIIGERIRNITIALIEVGTQKSLRSDIHSEVATRIPYGTYRMRVSAAGFRTVEREVRLNQPEVFMRTQLSVSSECGSFAEIGGSLQPAPGNREFWVKVVPVRGSGGAEAHVSPKGAFLISGLDDGDYFLLVLDGPAIVHTRSVRIAGSQRVSIELGTP